MSTHIGMQFHTITQNLLLKHQHKKGRKKNGSGDGQARSRRKMIENEKDSQRKKKMNAAKKAKDSFLQQLRGPIRVKEES